MTVVASFAPRLVVVVVVVVVVAGSRALRGQLQTTEACQCSMGICDAGPAGCAAAHGAGKEAERSVGNFQPQNLANAAREFAMLGQLHAQLCAALARKW